MRQRWVSLSMGEYQTSVSLRILTSLPVPPSMCELEATATRTLVLCGVHKTGNGRNIGPCSERSQEVVYWLHRFSFLAGARRHKPLTEASRLQVIEQIAKPSLLPALCCDPLLFASSQMLQCSKLSYYRPGSLPAANMPNTT